MYAGNKPIRAIDDNRIIISNLLLQLKKKKPTANIEKFSSPKRDTTINLPFNFQMK